MKLTEAQKKRLALLLQKQASNSGSITVDEQKEITDLTAKAIAEGIEDSKAYVEAEFIKAWGEPAAQEFTEGDLEAAVTKALTVALQGKSIDTASIVAEIKKSITPGETIKMADIEASIKKHVEGAAFDKDALVAEIKKSLPAAGMSKADLDNALAEFAKLNSRQDSKHQFPVIGGGGFPIEHRSGNLSVAQKQLLNLTMQHAPESALLKCKTVRPNGINDGIKADTLSLAEKVGAANVKAFRDEVIYGKALTTGGSGAALQTVDLSSDLQMRMYLDSQLASMMISSEIDMPTDPFKLPLKTGRTPYTLGSEAPGADPATSQPSFAQVTLDTSKLIGIAEYSYESDEDSIISILPMLQEDLASGAAYSFEDLLLNGDTTNAGGAGATQDNDVTGATNYLKAFNGLRKMCLAAAATKKDFGGVVPTALLISAMRKQMFRWGLRPKDLLLIVGPQQYNNIVMLTETLTFDKVGSSEAARILTGTAASIMGIPIVVSDACRENVAATGVNTVGGPNTFGGMVLMHRPSFVVGVKRGFTVEIDQNKRQQVNYVIASFRRDFKAKETVSATVPAAIAGFNILN